MVLGLLAATWFRNACMAECQLTLGAPTAQGYLFGGPPNKDSSEMGSILGFPNFGKLPHGLGFRCFLQCSFR